MPGRLRRHDAHGHLHFLTFCCVRRLPFFVHPSVCDAFLEAMRRVRANLGVRWIGYVIMPEHVHVLVLPQTAGSAALTPISTVLHDLKGHAGRRCKEALREVWRRQRTLGHSRSDAWACGDSRRFWKPRGHDFNVTSEEKVWEKLDYMHRNPLRRGLVDRPEHWPWSSYRFYRTGDSSVLAMDWDGTSPLMRES